MKSTLTVSQRQCLKVQSQDWKKTETGPDQDQSRPEILKTDQDRNRGPVFGLWPLNGVSSSAVCFVSAMVTSTRPSRPFSLMRAPLTVAPPFVGEHGHYQVNELCGNASLFVVEGKLSLLVYHFLAGSFSKKIFSPTCVINGWSHLGENCGRIVYKTSVPRIYC